MLADMVERLGRGGVASRAAIADTTGAAWATARYAKAAVTRSEVPCRRDGGSAPPLPIAALRLNGEVIAGLTRLGFDRIDQLLDAPRAPLTLRFGREVIRRIDRSLGRVEVVDRARRPAGYGCRPTFVPPNLFSPAPGSLYSRDCPPASLVPRSWNGDGGSMPEVPDEMARSSRVIRAVARTLEIVDGAGSR